MASPRGVVPIEVLREAARTYVAEVTLRPAAKEIGMSPSGLHTFLEGTTPQRGTVRKLTAWYFQRTAEGGDATSAEVASAALQVLLQPFAPGHRKSVARDVLKLLMQRCEELEVPSPPWLHALQRQVGAR
jgi:hypothetical protein